MKTRGSEEITLREGLGSKNTDKIFRVARFGKGFERGREGKSRVRR
jgi:hypothetical protein